MPDLRHAPPAAQETLYLDSESDDDDQGDATQMQKWLEERTLPLLKRRLDLLDFQRQSAVCKVKPLEDKVIQLKKLRDDYMKDFAAWTNSKQAQALQPPMLKSTMKSHEAYLQNLNMSIKRATDSLGNSRPFC